VRVFEAEPPEDVDWNTRTSTKATSWQRPTESRMAVSTDYAADLRHAKRCAMLPALAPSLSHNGIAACTAERKNHAKLWW
jgi:hypothetical protein